MIETPTGVANAFDIASVPGVDAIIVGNNDLSSFSGFAAGFPQYQQLITKIHDDTLRAGKIFGQANAIYAQGQSVEQGRHLLPERPFQRRLGSPANGNGAMSARFDTKFASK